MQNHTKQAFCLLSLLLLVPGCGNWYRKKEDQKNKKSMEKEVDVALDNNEVRSFFEDGEETQDFFLDEEPVRQEVAKYEITDNDVMQQVDTTGVVAEDATEFAWIKDEDKEEQLKVVYFGFDKSKTSAEQEAVVDYNADIIKKKIADAKDQQVKVMIDGYACDSAGTSKYNKVISERRATTLRNQLVARGISAESIKIVARGDEAPAVIDGKKVTGNRDEQWQNRRCEVHVVYT